MDEFGEWMGNLSQDVVAQCQSEQENVNIAKGYLEDHVIA